MAPEGSGRLVARNTLANASGRIVNAAMAIALTPFLLRNLGPGDYGIWVLATTLTFTGGWVNLAELGLQQAAVRLVAEARAAHDVKAVSEIVSTATAVFAALGVALGGLGVALAWPLARLFNVGAGHEEVAAAVFALMAVQVTIDLPATGVAAALEGAQRYGWLRLVDGGGRLLWAMVTVLVVTSGRGVLAIAASSVGAALLTLGAGVVTAHRAEPGLALGAGRVRVARARRLVATATPMFGLRILSVVYSQMDRVIVAVALSAAAVAAYEVAYKVHAVAALVLGVAASAVMPAAAYLGRAEDDERLRHLFLRGTTYAVGLAVPVCLSAALYAKALIATWVGTSYTPLTWPTRAFLAYPALAVVLAVGQSMLVGLGRMRLMLRLHVVAVSINLAVSVLLVGPIGVGGVILGTLAGSVVLWGPAQRLLLREFGVSTSEWLHTAFVPTLPAVVGQLLLGLATIRLVEGFGQFWQVVLACLVNYAVGLALFARIGLGPGDRRALGSLLRRPAGGVDPELPLQTVGPA